ncbi:MAG TPA: serine/threonine-protein kinase [Actinomycetota bacterium]|jgi:serine/threonine protein kinase|nr:serine/threonine-protein kinase [Actinomycetota bacterium]
MASPVVPVPSSAYSEGEKPVNSAEMIAGRYELGELVGSGGMGEVYAGRDTKLDRAVALKFLRKDMASHEDLRSRFEAEARAAGRLSHANVVGVFDTGEHEGNPFIVMELLSGRTLADEAVSGPATEARARQVCREIVSALKASHTQGVLHRDLKPGNVLLCEDGSVKVGDFGVAKMAEGMDLTQAGIMLGTPAYLAPERIEGEPASAASDIYSVGVMLYEFLAGRKPFDADTPLGMIRAIQEEQVPSLTDLRPDVDPEFAAVIGKAMARDPALRYASAAEMEADLIEPVVQPPTGDATLPQGVPNPTRVMETPGAPRGTNPTLVSRPAVRKRTNPWDRLTRRNKMGVIIAAALLLFTLIVVRGFSDDTNSVSPSPAASPAETAGSGSGEVPAPLENALKELEEAVAP